MVQTQRQFAAKKKCPPKASDGALRTFVRFRALVVLLKYLPQEAGLFDRTISLQVGIDDATGNADTRATMWISPEEVARLGHNDIAPGTPVETFIRIETRTVVSDPLQPIVDPMNRTFREE